MHSETTSTQATPVFKDKEFFKLRPKQIMELVKTITPIMNELHQVNHSNRFWLRLLSLHLRSCVGQRQFFQEKNFNPKVPLTTINSFSPISRKQVIIDWMMYVGRSLKNRNSGRKIMKKISSDTNICVGARGTSIARHINGTFVEDYYPLFSLLSPSHMKRRKLKALTDNLSDEFERNMLLSMPKIFVEYFSDFYNPINVQEAPSKSFHYEHIGGPFMDYLLAKYQESGSKIIAYQTGGFMGEVENHPDENLYQIIDELRTYGWKQHQKDAPFRAFRLEEYAKEWNILRSDRLDYDILIVFSIRNEVTKSHYSKFVKDFFTQINRKKYPNIIVRPRPISRNLNNAKEAKKIGVPENVSIDNGRNKIVETAAKSRLVIQVWMPSTNFLECLKVDQPVMALDTNDQPSELYQEYSSHLNGLGILHKDTQSLVEFMNQLDDIDTWWRNVLHDPSCRIFKEVFCGGIINTATDDKSN